MASAGVDNISVAIADIVIEDVAIKAAADLGIAGVATVADVDIVGGGIIYFGTTGVSTVEIAAISYILKLSATYCRFSYIM